MTQTLHEIVMQLDGNEGLSPGELWALKHLAEARGDELAAAQQRVKVLEDALRPFAQMPDSSFFCDGLHEADMYAVVLAQYHTDFTGVDLIRARAALAASAGLIQEGTMNALMTIADAVLCVVPVVAVILAMARLANAVDEVNARD